MNTKDLITDYLYITQKNTTKTDNKMLKAMHLINRISLLLFLLGLMIIVARGITIITIG